MADLIELLPFSEAEGRSLQISHRLSKITEPPTLTHPFLNSDSPMVMEVIYLG